MKKLLFALLLLPLPAMAQWSVPVYIYNSSPVVVTIRVNTGTTLIAVGAANAADGFAPRHQSTRVMLTPNGSPAGTFMLGNNTLVVVPSAGIAPYTTSLFIPKTAAKFKSIQLYIAYTSSSNMLQLTLLGDGQFIATWSASPEAR